MNSTNPPSPLFSEFQKNWAKFSQSTNQRLTALESQLTDLQHSVKNLLDSVAIAKERRSELKEDLDELRRILNQFVGSLRTIRKELVEVSTRLTDLEGRMRHQELKGAKLEEAQKEIRLLRPLIQELLKSFDYEGKLQTQLTRVEAEQKRQASIIQQLQNYQQLPNPPSEVPPEKINKLTDLLEAFLQFGENWKKQLRKPS